MLAPPLHLDRARAESFGTAAEAYDRLRPDFPPELMDDIAAYGATAVDIGCGTGKVARALARRGVSVLGVEVDPAMAAVARGHGVVVEVARFESWNDRARTFDIVSCGDTWHWLDPELAAAKAARVLAPGGVFARFWNLQLLDDHVLHALDAVYRAHAPEVYLYGRTPEIPSPDPFDALPGPFAPIAARMYMWDRHVTGDEWAAFVSTISDHRQLPADQLVRLQAAIRTALAELGTPIRVRGITTARVARRITGD